MTCPYTARYELANQAGETIGSLVDIQLFAIKIYSNVLIKVCAN
jgi:hypothetical protein